MQHHLTADHLVYFDSTSNPYCRPSLDSVAAVGLSFVHVVIFLVLVCIVTGRPHVEVCTKMRVSRSSTVSTWTRVCRLSEPYRMDIISFIFSHPHLTARSRSRRLKRRNHRLRLQRLLDPSLVHRLDQARRQL